MDTERTCEVSDNTPLDPSRYEGMTEGNWIAKCFNVFGVRNDGIDAVIASCGGYSSNKYDSTDESLANARAIADVPKMIAEIKRLRAELAELQKGRAK